MKTALEVQRDRECIGITDFSWRGAWRATFARAPSSKRPCIPGGMARDSDRNDRGRLQLAIDLASSNGESFAKWSSTPAMSPA